MWESGNSGPHRQLFGLLSVGGECVANELVLLGWLGWPVEVYGGLESNFGAVLQQANWPAKVVARVEILHMGGVKASKLASQGCGEGRNPTHERC